VAGIGRDRLGDPDGPDLPRLLQFFEPGTQPLGRVLVVLDGHPVEVVDVHVVGVEALQARVEAPGQFRRRPALVAVVETELRGDHDVLPVLLGQRSSDHPLRAVRFCRVDEIDSEVESRLDDLPGCLLGLLLAQSEPARAAGSETHHTGLHPGRSEFGVLHAVFRLRTRLSRFRRLRPSRPASPALDAASPPLLAVERVANAWSTPGR
jgi:hypothetical protein